MTESHIVGKTLDDLMRRGLQAIQDAGQEIRSRRGDALEITGVLMELENPRARLSRTDTRGKPYSCLGELCWYLAGSDDLEFIAYYIPRYRQEADGQSVPGRSPTAHEASAPAGRGLPEGLSRAGIVATIHSLKNRPSTMFMLEGR